MINLEAVYKPKTMDEALALMKRPGAVVMGGASGLIASRRKDVRAVVDLAALGLDYVRDKQGAVAIGAMTHLSDLADSPILRAAADGVVAEGARRSVSSLLRNQATAAGTLISEPAGLLAVVLSALDAVVTLVSSEPITLFAGGQGGEYGASLLDFLRAREHLANGWIVTEVLVPAGSLARRATIETVARTPLDRPIVSVCTSMEMTGGKIRSIAIALGGVAETVVRASAAEAALKDSALVDSGISMAAIQAAQGLVPRSDFRGSAEYRREMVGVLVARALRSVGNRPQAKQ